MSKLKGKDPALTREQVYEISRLVDLLKVDDKDIAKILSKANAEKLREYQLALVQCFWF